jgi:hypothetical protein
MGLGLGLGSCCKRFVLLSFYVMTRSNGSLVATIDGYQFHLCVFKLFSCFYTEIFFEYQPITEQ